MSVESANQTDPKVLPLPGSQGQPRAPGNRWRQFIGLLWCEWYMHSKLLLVFIGAWLALVWLLPLYANPAWLLLLGAIFAIVAGPVYGGSDTSDGCEEFTFTLSPSRAERYLARLAVGGGAFLLLSALDLLGMGLDLPQILARLYVASGLIRPWPELRSGLLYGLVLALPLAMFSTSFAASAVTHSRAFLFSAWLWAGLISLATLRLGFWYEELVWGKLNGWFSCPLLAALSVAVLCGGYVAYCRKEVGQHSPGNSIPPRWWFWIIVCALGLLLTLTLAASLAKYCPRIFSESQEAPVAAVTSLESQSGRRPRVTGTLKPKHFLKRTSPAFFQNRPWQNAIANQPRKAADEEANLQKCRKRFTTNCSIQCPTAHSPWTPTSA